MRVLLDNNVILDAMLQRLPWHKEADAILQAAAQGQVTCATTPLSLATIFYVGRQVVGTTAARYAVRKYLVAFDILPVDRQTLLDADAFHIQRAAAPDLGVLNDCGKRVEFPGGAVHGNDVEMIQQ